MMEIVVWVHLLAAVSWIGGMIFLTLVLVPIFRREGFGSERGELFRTIARRFRIVVWGAVAVLLTSGPVLLHLRGLSIADPTEWPPVLSVKLRLVAILLALTLAHDLVVGPRMADIRTRSDSSHQVLRVISAWLPRLSLVLALVVLGTAVVLARS